jgi:hypothetical protein
VTWLVGTVVTGGVLMWVAYRVRGESRWLLVVGLVVGSSVRALSSGSSPAFVPGPWALAVSPVMPAGALWALSLAYASFWLVPLVVVRTAGSRAAAAVVVAYVVASSMQVLVPTAPPWWSGETERVMAGLPVLSGVMARDVSPFAALPSTHVAVPVAVAFAGRSWRWGAYALLTSVVVVLVGEHWALDVGAGWALGIGAAAVVASGLGDRSRVGYERISREMSSSSAGRWMGAVVRDLERRVSEPVDKSTV